MGSPDFSEVWASLTRSRHYGITCLQSLALFWSVPRPLTGSLLLSQSSCFCIVAVPRLPLSLKTRALIKAGDVMIALKLGYHSRSFYCLCRPSIFVSEQSSLSAKTL